MKTAYLLSLIVFFIFTNSSFSHTEKVHLTQKAFIYESVSSLTKSELLKTLTKRSDLVVGHPNSEGFEVYGDETLYKILDELKISYKVINTSSKDELRNLGHPTHSQITEKMNELSETYKDFMVLESIGKSVQGKDLWVMRIGRLNEENKKHIFYIANMHGDEITGRELMIMLIEELGEKLKNKDNQILSLMDQIIFHVLPSLNPDGADRKRRANANFVDLNRDFPDWTRGNANTPEGREPEVIAIMNYYKKYHFDLSANFHGGAEVVNYPWDNSPDEGEQENFIQQLSKDYISNGAEYMKSPSFPEGIIRGYDWYPVYGGLQDWSTHYHNSPHVTIELSNKKWPHFDDMAFFYENNRQSLLRMPEAINTTR